MYLSKTINNIYGLFKYVNRIFQQARCSGCKRLRRSNQLAYPICRFQRTASACKLFLRNKNYSSNFCDKRCNSGLAKAKTFFLTALEGETNIALNVVGRTEFETAAARIREAAEKTGSGQYGEAMKLLSEAISHVASTGQWAMQTLKNNHLL